VPISTKEARQLGSEAVDDERSRARRGDLAARAGARESGLALRRSPPASGRLGAMSQRSWRRSSRSPGCGERSPRECLSSPSPPSPPVRWADDSLCDLPRRGVRRSGARHGTTYRIATVTGPAGRNGRDHEDEGGKDQGRTRADPPHGDRSRRRRDRRGPGARAGAHHHGRQILTQTQVVNQTQTDVVTEIQPTTVVVTDAPWPRPAPRP
jgi:hypothetical protein